MTAVPFVVVVTVSAAISLATQPSPDAKIVEIEIVVGNTNENAKVCKSGGVPPSTVFVSSSTQISHCIGNNLHDHAGHGKNPDLEAAVVPVRAGQSIHWVSKKNRFLIVEVVKHDPPGSAAPPKKEGAQPPDELFELLPRDFRLQVVSPPLPDLPGTVVQRYKYTFVVEGIGLIDPDLICTM